MPELSSVQTYERVTADNFKDVLTRFSDVLKDIGLWNREVANAFEKAEWSNDEYFFPIRELGYFKNDLSNVEIRPLIMVSQDPNGCWMYCQLLMETNKLYAMHKDRFRPFIQTLVWEMFDQHHTATYFTDEAQDGQPLEGIIESDQSKLWEFDYALIPSGLVHLHLDQPVTHNVKDFGDYLEVWFEDRW